MNKIEKIEFGIFAIIVCGAAMKGCAILGGNTDIVDTEKTFNIVLDQSDNAISIASIVDYTDYEGSQIQFTTQDNLIVLTSVLNTQLIRQYDFKLVKDYATCLANGNESMVYSYDELQGLDTTMEESGWNKNFIDLQYTYNYALIQSNEGVTIAEIDSWKTYESDDKIQVILTNGTTILKDAKDIKLLNDIDAGENSVYNYALSLVGDESKIHYYSAPKQLIR